MRESARTPAHWGTASSKKVEHLRFATKTGDPVAVERERLGQDLQSDVAIQFGVAGAINLAHAARTDGRQDLIRAESSAGSKRHGK